MAIKEYIKNSHKPENVREYYINNHPHWPGLNPYIKFTPGISSIYVGATGEMFPASTNYKEVLAPADINNSVYLKDILCENGELLFDGDITKFYIVADPEISGRFFINGTNIGNIATNQDSPNIMVLDEEAANKYEPRRYATEHSIKKSILHANIKYTYYDVTNTLQSGTVSSGTKALNEPYPWWGTTISWQSIPAVGYEFTGAESTYKGSIIAGTGAAVIEPTTSPTAKSYSVYKNATNGATITVNNTGTFDSALSISIGGLKSSSWLKSASITGPETTLNYGDNSYTMTGVYYTDITVNAEGNLMNLYNAASSATGVTITYPNYGEATVIRGDSTWNTSSDKFQFKLNEGYNFPITLTIKDNSTGTDYSNFSITAADCDYNSSTGVYTLKTPSEIINTSYVENTQIYTIAATRITWSPTITLGTGVAKFVYSIDGTTWSSTEYTSGASIVIDYADTCYVKASTASSGYVLENQSYATCTYSSQSVTVPKAAKFTVNVTRATGVATYSYSTNDGTSYTNGVTAASFTCPTGNTAKVKPYTASNKYTVDTTTVQLTATTPASITLVPATAPFYMDHRFEGTVFETTGPYSVAYNGTIEASDYIELTEFETPAYWYYNGSNTIVSDVKSEMTINIDWATRKVHTYTITWKYLSAYPSTWTTTTETYNYNATPSRTGNNVTNSADNAREYFLQWDSLSNVTSDRTITGQYKRQYKLTFSGTRCTTDTKYLSGWYDSSETAFTYTWTAGTSSDRTNYAFDSGGTQKTATQSITPNQAGIYSKSADYIYVKINSTNSTASIDGTAIDDGWRWVRYDIQCTWTATTNYAYSNSGLSTSSINLTEAGKDAYDSAPTHGYYTVSTDADKYTANSSTGWYEVTDSKTTRFTAKNDWSFNGSSANDYIDRSSAVPGGVSVTPNYAKITVAGSNDTIYVGSTQRDSNWSGVVALDTTIRWVPNTYYSFTAGTAQTEATSTVTAPATYANTPTCIKAASITGSYCDSISKNANTYYASNNLTITWTADNNHSFNGSAVSDTSTATLTAGGTFARTPSYVQINVESARCQANDGTKDISSGWIGLVANGTRITWTADTGYSFADGTTQSATIYKDVSLDSPYLYKGSADYKYVTFSGTSCTAYFDSETSAPDGYRLLGRSFFWKADNNYAFDNTGKDTLNSNIVVGTTNYIGSANFMNITIGGTRCESNIPSGFHEIGATLDWDANNNCAFNSTGTQTTTSLTVERGVFNYEPTANYIYVSISAGTGCTTPSTTGWYQYNTKCTWTRNTGYAFDASGTTQAFDYLTTPGGSYSKTPTHCYLTIDIDNTKCTCDKSSAWYKITDATSVIAKFTPKANYSFDAGTTATTYTAPAVVMNQPRTVSASPTNVLGKITYTNCQVSNSIPSDTNYYFTNNGTITCTATDGYAYTTTATTEQKTWTLGCTLTSDPGYVKVSLDLTNCVYASGHANNQYVAKETNVSTVVNASNYWSFTSGATSSASTRPTGGASKTLTSSNVQAPVILSASPSYCFGKIAYLYTTYQTNQYDHNGHAESGYWVPGDFTVYASNGYAWDSAGTTFNKVYSWYANCDITAKADYFSASVVATHCKATYLSTSSSATSGSPNYTYFGIDNTVYAFATLKDNTAQYYYTPKDTWTLITGRTYRVGSVTAASPNISVAANSNIASYTIKISAGANSKITSCSSNLTIASDKSYASGTVDYGAEVSATATANSNYAYDSNGTSTKSYSATVSGEITTTIAAPNYLAYTIKGVSRTDKTSDSTKYAQSGSTISHTWTTSQTYYAFDSSGTRTASASATVSDLGVVLSVAEPGWYYYGTWPAAAHTDHTTDSTVGWKNTSTYTVTYTASTNYAYNSSGTTTADSTANPGEDFTAKVPGYGYLTATTTHCDIVENGSGWYNLGKNIVTTYRASSDWSFGGSTLKDTTTTTTTVPNSVSASPGYCNVTINATNSKATIGTTDVSGTTAIRALNTSITWTPNTYYSFSAGTDQTNTTATISGPGTYSKSPTNYRAASIASSSYCTPNRNTNTYYASGTTITWTAGSNYSFGGSNTGDTTTPSTTITAGASMAAPTPGYMKATYSGTNVSKIYRVVGSGVEETMVNSNIYPVGTTIYWIASTATNTQYSFTNSSVTSPTTSTSETLALNKLTYTYDANYVYYNVTITKGTNTASSNYASGYLLNGTTITFTTTAATSTKRYSYSSSSSTVNTENKTVSSAGQSITSDSVYIWMNCTFTGTNCSATNGWYIVGTNITWTGDTGTNYKYSFTNTPVRNPSDAQRQTTSTVVEDTTSYSKTASYVYYNVNIAPATNCTANYTSGWGYFLNGTTIKFTATTATDAVRYSFSTSSSTSYEVTSQVSSSVAGGNIASGTVYIWRYCTIGAKYSSTVLASQKQWYRDSTTCSSASYYNTDSYTDPRTTSEYNKKYYYTGKTTNSITVSSSATEVYTVYSTQNKINYTVSFTKASGSYGSWTVSSISAAWDAAISRSGDTITIGSSTNTYGGYNATGYTTTVSYTNDSGTVGTANKTITATTTRTGNTYTLTSTNNHCVVKYYSDSGYTNQITQARYGSTIYVTVNPDSYYYWDIKANAHGNDYTAGGYTVTGTISGSNINIGTFTASPFSYTYSATSANGVCTPGTTNAVTYGSNTSMSINPDTHYYYSSTSYYHGVPYTYSNRPLTTANYTFSTSTADGTATATYVSACTAITYTYSISSANSAYCYHGKTQPSSANTTAQTGTYADRASTYVYYRINPASRYEVNYNSQRGYNGSPIGDTSHYAVGSNFTFTDSNRTATLAINCTPITYTVTASLGNAGVQVGVSTNVYNTSLSKTYAELYTSNPSIYVKVTPNSHYGMTVGGTWYYNGNPLTGSSYYVEGNTFTFTDSNKTATCALSTSTYPISAIAYTASVSASNSNCTLGTASGSYSSTISLTYQSATIYLRQAPSEHYEVTYGSTRYYYGYNYTTNVNYTSFSFSDANKTATYALTGCSETTYTWTVSSTNSNYVYYNTTGSPSSATTISKKYSDNPTIYYKINAEDYYYCNSTSYPKGTPYSSSVNRGSFSFSYANKTAIFKKNCTSFTYTCKPTTVTGGTVSWNPATITAGGSSSWTITANTGYNTPSTYQGSVAWANFTKSTSTANGDATASNLPNCTRKSFTITLSGPDYGAWRTSNSTSGTAVTSQTAYYGDIITSSGNTLTCYRWDATSTARWTVYAVASATTAQYSYSTPTISGTSSDPITDSKTITAANTRTTRTYTVTFTATNGSWSTTSIANVPYGTTWSTSGLTVTLSGSYGSSTYTKRATTVDYTSGDATITSTSGTVQGATSISAVTATTARKYTIRWIGADGSTALETDSDVAYNATLTYNGSTPTKASTAQYNYTFSAWKLGSTSGSTVTSGTTKNPGSTSSTTINIYATFTSTVRSYNVTIKKGGTTAAISSGTYQVDSGSATAISWGNAFTVEYGSYVKNVSATASASSPAISSLTAPTVAQSTGDYSGTKVRVTNNNSLQVTCYYGTSSGSTTNSTTISASSSKEITGLTAGTTYYFFFRVVKTNYSISSYDPSAASGSTGVQITGTTTITVNGSSSTQNINSSNVSCQPVAKQVPLHMEYYYEGTKLFTNNYNYAYNSSVDTTLLLVGSYKSGAYEYGDPRYNDSSQTEIDPLTTETTVVINYATRSTAYYSITVQAKYNGNVITSQTVSKTYNSSISSTSYYGTSFDYGGYSYTGGSGQSITVTGDATIATTYSTQSYRSYTLNQGTHTNCTFSSTTGSYNTAKSLSFSPATGYGYPITYSVGTSSGGTDLKGNTEITSGTGTYTMTGTYYSTVYVNCSATAKTYTINAGTLTGVSFSSTTGTYGTQKTIAISLQSSYGYPVSWSLKSGSTTVASGTLNSSADSIKYTMNSSYYSSLSLNATATSTAFSWISYGNIGGWGNAWDKMQDMTLASAPAFYKIEQGWASEALTYDLYRANLDPSTPAASSEAFNSWLEAEGYFWATTETTRNDFIAQCLSMSDAGYFNFAFILEGGTGNDPIRIFLRK